VRRFTMPYDALVVANHLLKAAQKRNLRLTPMHLLKLSYIAHGLSLAVYNSPLVSESVQAWDFGPVIPSIYHEFKQYGSDPVTDLARDPYTGRPLRSDVGGEVEKLLELVVDKYGAYEAFRLSALTHKEGTPWQQTYRAGERNLIIPNSLISEHFKSHVKPPTTVVQSDH
jgi:uncharacterized phage-associated protein